VAHVLTFASTTCVVNWEEDWVVGQFVRSEASSMWRKSRIMRWSHFTGSIPLRQRVRVQAEVRPSDYSQTTLPKNMRTINEGMQNPVLTFTKAAATSDQPTT